MPVHRCFAFFFTRFLLKDLTKGSQAMREAFEEALPNRDMETDDVLKKVMLILIKQISFLNEVTSRKWIYLGQALEMYPNLYFKLSDRFAL